MTRATPALGAPPASVGALRSFPRWRLTPARVVHRAHGLGRGRWWFGSDGSGRFDLPAPRGTCYLAATPAAALRERFGARLTTRQVVVRAEAARTVVSALHLPAAARLADTCSGRAAGFGVTRELGTVTPYDLPQRWAAAFAAAGCAGVRYPPRFSTGARDLAYAVFGPAGANLSLAVDPDPVDGVTAARAAGLRVVDVPARVPVTPPRPA